MSNFIKQRNEDCLYWYFQTLKDLGTRVRYEKQSDLYAIAGEKVYLSGEYAGKIINSLMKDGNVRDRVAKRVK